MPDKTALQAQLAQLTTHWTSLQAAVVERQQEIQQIDSRRVQLHEEILRNQGAMAYNQMLAKEVKSQLEDSERGPAVHPLSQ